MPLPTAAPQFVKAALRRPVFLVAVPFLGAVSEVLAFADFDFSRAIFSSSRMEASAAFTTAGRRSRGMVSAASKKARVRVLVPRNARVVWSAIVSSFGCSAPINDLHTVCK